eukprot:3569837-Amphidinium_carterae.1
MGIGWKARSAKSLGKKLNTTWTCPYGSYRRLCFSCEQATAAAATKKGKEVEPPSNKGQSNGGGSKEAVANPALKTAVEAVLKKLLCLCDTKVAHSSEDFVTLSQKILSAGGHVGSR